MITSQASSELQAALAQIGQPDEMPEAEAARIRLHSRPQPNGYVKVHIPPRSILQMMGRDFVVIHISRTAIMLAVASIPEGFAEGRQLEIFGGMFNVHKVTLPEKHGKPYRVALHPGRKTKIDPRPIHYGKAPKPKAPTGEDTPDT